METAPRRAPISTGGRPRASAADAAARRFSAFGAPRRGEAISTTSPVPRRTTRSESPSAEGRTSPVTSAPAPAESENESVRSFGSRSRSLRPHASSAFTTARPPGLRSEKSFAFSSK